jgi:hypothetical protein
MHEKNSEHFKRFENKNKHIDDINFVLLFMLVFIKTYIYVHVYVWLCMGKKYVFITLLSLLL